MAAAFMAAFVQILTITANVTAMWRMRAEMATTPEAKAAAIDEGLKFSDAFRKIAERIRGHIAELRDDDDKPADAPGAIRVVTGSIVGTPVKGATQ